MKLSAPCGLIRSVALILLTAATAPAEDWPYWRGPHQNGVADTTGLIVEWDARSGENVLWRNEDAGGRSTPIIMDGRLYTLTRAEPGTPREGEKVVCLDAETGEKLWEHRFNVYLSDVPDTRVGWSCVTGDPETGYVYAQGVCGAFFCLDAKTGKVIWDRSLHEEFGLLSTYGGRTNTPIVFEDLVITSAIVIGWGEMAKPAHRFLAFDKRTGEVVWFNGTRLLPYDTTYSTPFLTVLDGEAAMVFGSGDGAVWAFQPRTGKPIWKYQFSRRGLNVSPIVVGNKVFTGHSEEQADPGNPFMGAIVGINALGEGDITKSGELWKHTNLMAGKCAPVYIDGRLYMAGDRAEMWVIDTESGKVLEDQRLVGTMMRASLLYADGKIYAPSTSAWHVLEPTKDGVKMLERDRLPRGEEVHGSPIAVDHKIYLPTTAALYCLGSKDAASGGKKGDTAQKSPAEPAETPVSENPDPAWVQIVPAESLIQPGESLQFKVKLYNSKGQFLREADNVEFSVDQGGKISSDGKFVSDKAVRHKAAFITAKVGDIDGTARVRIVPNLPWEFDFEDGEVPITWVGARYRHKVATEDGNTFIIKRNDIPKGARSRAWMGQPSLSDYTIQADVLGTVKEGQSEPIGLPDIGLIAQRYTLDLMGASQQLQIRSWVTQLRMAKTVPFSWERDTWYTMKFQATVEDGKAVLRGKVWPRDEKEPAEWTVTAVDEAPNLQGSPGLYGNAQVSELYLDNIKVTPNKK